jgi:hypothetical protein
MVVFGGRSTPGRIPRIVSNCGIHLNRQGGQAGHVSLYISLSLCVCMHLRCSHHKPARVPFINLLDSIYFGGRYNYSKAVACSYMHKANKQTIDQCIDSRTRPLLLFFSLLFIMVSLSD